MIRRDEHDTDSNKADPHEVYHRFGGREMMLVSNNREVPETFAGTIEKHQYAPKRSGGFRYGDFYGAETYGEDPNDVSRGYQALASHNQGSVAGSYTARGGESLQGLAQSLYGDASRRCRGLLRLQPVPWTV